MLRRLVVAGVTVAAVVATTLVVQVAGGSPQARAEGLVPYGDCTGYLAQMRLDLEASATPDGVSTGWSAYDGGRTTSGLLAATSGDSVLQFLSMQTTAKSVAGGPTGTNLQEEGVDEPDLAKLADGRIVTVDNEALRVRRTGAKPRLLGTLEVTAPKFEVRGVTELLIVGERAVVVQTGVRLTSLDPQGRPVADPSPKVTTGLINLPPQGQLVTRLLLVDLAGGQPVLLESATYDGTYLSARLVGDTVRLVTDYRAGMRGVAAVTGAPTSTAEALAANRRIAAGATIDDVLPHVTRRVGATERRTTAVDCAQISRPREGRGSGMLVVSTLRPAVGLEQVDRDAVLTDGQLVYASMGRLYVATSPDMFTPMSLTLQPMTSDSVAPVPATEPTTEVHVFDTTDTDATRYVGSGSVPGHVIGRWAFSEHEGVLRVATTRLPSGSQFWDGDVPTPGAVSSSMVVKLREDADGDLVEIGRIAGLGKTEEIKSVRYMGDLAAVVTFRETDPLYLVDLAGKPRLLGELKVPGYSTYLHPIGNGQLLALGLGAGKDGSTTVVQASVFDVANPSRPRLVDRLSVGEGESPALQESRAFTYDPARRLLLLPFTGWAYESSDVLAIRVATDGTLTRVGSVEVGGAGDEGEGIQPAERVLVDAQNFYGIQGDRVITGDLDTLRRTG